MNLKERISLCWRILRAKPNSLMAHAEAELPFIGDDEMGLLMAKQLREIVLVFGTHGHSGFSANYACDTLSKLLRYEPLAPITGAPDEWVEVWDGVLQNRRCIHVFKDPSMFDGQAYDINAVVFEEPSGACYTGRGSGQPITFPYTPRSIYLQVDDDGRPINGWDREGICPQWVQGEKQ